jgi:hypothetical protein
MRTFIKNAILALVLAVVGTSPASAFIQHTCASAGAGEYVYQQAVTGNFSAGDHILYAEMCSEGTFRYPGGSTWGPDACMAVPSNAGANVGWYFTATKESGTYAVHGNGSKWTHSGAGSPALGSPCYDNWIVGGSGQQ